MTSEENEESPVMQTLKELRNDDPEWIDFALQVTTGLEREVDLVDSLDERASVGVKLFVLSCFSDYYQLVRHYDLDPCEYDFVAEIPQGMEWVRYTDIGGRQSCRAVSQSVLDAERPRSAIVLEGIEDSGPEMNGYMLPRTEGGDVFDTIMCDHFLPKYEPGYKCTRDESTLRLEWGVHTLAEVLSKPNVGMWEIDLTEDANVE